MTYDEEEKKGLRLQQAVSPQAFNWIEEILPWDSM